MTKLFALLLVAASVGLTACSGMSGKTYPAPYAHERTAGGMTDAATGEPVFEKKMAK